MFLKRVNSTLVLFFIAVVSVNAAPTELTGAQRLTQQGLTETCISEPVFNGEACVFQANKSASKTVVLVHGIAGEAANWFQQIQKLKSNYHVLTFDLPGFGVSSKDNRLYSPTNYAKFIRFITQKFAKDKFHLLGHSMGGAISLRYAGMYPQDVDRLILVDAAGILHKHAYSRTVAAKWINIVQRISYWAGPNLNGYASMVLEAIEEFMPVDMQQAIKSPEIRQMILRSNAIPISGVAMITEDFSGVMKKVQSPTLIIWGEYDLVAPVRTGKILQANLNKAYLRVLANAGHSSMADRPIEFNQLMMNHLQQSDKELAGSYWKARPFVKSQRVGKCSQGEQKLFEGTYAKIELDNCTLAQIQNAQIGQLVARNSLVQMEYSTIETSGIGLLSYDSEINLTSSTIRGDIAIQTVRSRLDVAGVKLTGNRVAINNLSDSTIVFSLSWLQSSTYRGGKHEYLRLAANESL